MRRTVIGRGGSTWIAAILSATLCACGGQTPPPQAGQTAPSSQAGQTASPSQAGQTASPSQAGQTASPSAGSVVNSDSRPVSLRLAIADPEGRQSEPAVRFFTNRVAELSGGSVEIVPRFAAGDATPEGFELGVANLVLRGDAELAMVGSRVWDLVGVKSLAVLQAPMVVDNDRLALEVARGSVGRTALDGMGAVGLEGLALWPEDLRHLFSFDACNRDFRSPEAVAGSTVVVLPSQISLETIHALGGSEYTGNSRGPDAASCKVQGMETGLVGTGMPTPNATTAGNVVLFPKFQTLAANAAALSRMSEAQRSAIRQAAIDTATDAFTRQPVEADLATAWCAGGGSVTSASATEWAAIVRAVEPVRTELAQDPASATLLSALLDLKAQIPPSESAGSCGPAPADPGTTPDLSGYSGGHVPTGTYRLELSEQEMVARGAGPHFAHLNAGIWTLTIEPGAWSMTHRNGPNNEDCSGTITAIPGPSQKFVTTVDNGCGLDEYSSAVWLQDENGITFLDRDYNGWTDQDIIDASAGDIGHEWLRID